MTQPNSDRHSLFRAVSLKRALALAAGAGLAGLVLAGPLHAQTDGKKDGEGAMAAETAAAPSESGRTAADAIEDPRTIATVGGDPITDADLALSAQDLSETIARYPDEQKAGILVNFLINQKLMAQAAAKENVQETPAFKQRMALLRDRTLRDLYFQQAVREKITEEDIKKAYDETAAQISGEEEVHARHILVKTEDEAKELVKELEGGKDFAELAKEKSTGPSGPNGGDLGFFGKQDMVAPFAEAAFALEEGKISEPVKTEFGWHVIKVEERRTKAAPPLDQVKDKILDNLVRARYFELIEELKKDAEIKVLDKDGNEVTTDTPDEAKDK